MFATTKPTDTNPTPAPGRPTFSAAGRTWELRLTVWTLTEVQKSTGVELAKALQSEKGFADLLFADPGTLAGILWTLIEDQATAAGVTPEQFGRSLDGPTIEKATEALLMAVADFVPRSRIGQAIRDNLPKVLAAADAAAVNSIVGRVPQS